MKVVINRCYGGFALSKEAYDFMGIEWDGFGFKFNDDRTNPKLIKCIEALGKKANGSFASLKVVKIPDGIEWEISEYDGLEAVEEKHRSWF